ncbi:MAG TPA: flavin reductase family protein [Epsilonproteobacteria bacterium]|nr:flavin reductase family protein [Campylobacterota bacterium]
MFTTAKSPDTTSHAQPRPVTLLSVGHNFMPLSWHMPVSKSPFRYAVCVRDENISHGLLHRYREFALNFLDFSYIEAYEKSGSSHGGEKFGLTDLTPKKADTITTTLIEEAYMIYECRIIDITGYGDHDIFVADVTMIHNKKVEVVKPVLFLGQGYYETTSHNPQRIAREEND